jgi:hypothetical protein
MSWNRIKAYFLKELLSLSVSIFNVSPVPVSEEQKFHKIGLPRVVLRAHRLPEGTTFGACNTVKLKSDG